MAITINELRGMVGNYLTTLSKEETHDTGESDFDEASRVLEGFCEHRFPVLKRERIATELLCKMSNNEVDALREYFANENSMAAPGGQASGERENDI